MGSRTIEEMTALFNACFRIQREAIEAAGRYIPMIVENVRGAQPWVGLAKANYGSFYLWGDISMNGNCIIKPDFAKPYRPETGVPWLKAPGRRGGKVTGFRFDEAWRSKHYEDAPKMTNQREHDGVKLSMPGDDSLRVGFQQNAALALKGSGDGWFNDAKRKGGTETGYLSRSGSKSDSRKAASALIAKIPEPLSRWVGRVYRP